MSARESAKANRCVKVSHILFSSFMGSLSVFKHQLAHHLLRFPDSF
jgi:hypothetical protein